MSSLGPSCLFLLLASLSWWELVVGYANGKVTKACSSMEPHHHSQGQTDPSPFYLMANTSTFVPGEYIEVKVWGLVFEGFLLQARDAAQGSQSTVGSFLLTDPRSTQLLTCNKHQGSAVSHTTKSKKRLVTVIWIAPPDAPSQVQFLATVVSHYNVFWVKIPGPIISQHGITPRPPGPLPTSDALPKTTTSVLPGPFSSEGCGHSRSCLLDPPGCNPKENPHCFFLSATTEGPPHQMSVVFELSGPAEGYIAFALSWDKWMGSDDVYLCVNENGRVTVEAAILSGRKYPEEQTESGLHSQSWRLADGVIQCRFSRPVILTNQESERFNLDQEYFLFVASGGAQQGQIWKHSRQPLISEHKVLLTGAPILVQGSRGPILMKGHGVLMLTAWMLTGSLGTFIASFYKNEWVNHTLLGQKIWFQIHRGLMMLTVALTAVGFCLPFIYRRGWSTHAGVHPYLGCCVLGFSLLQPIIASLRPPPDSHRRYIFNWLHWALGSVTEILAVTAMFLGVNQSSLLLPSPLATHILIGYVSWLVAFRVLLFFHIHFYMTKLRADDQRAILSDQLEAMTKSPWFKSLVLVVVTLGNVGLLTALLSSIIQI